MKIHRPSNTVGIIFWTLIFITLVTLGWIVAIIFTLLTFPFLAFFVAMNMLRTHGSQWNRGPTPDSAISLKELRKK